MFIIKKLLKGGKHVGKSAEVKTPTAFRVIHLLSILTVKTTVDELRLLIKLSHAMHADTPYLIIYIH